MYNYSCAKVIKKMQKRFGLLANFFYLCKDNYIRLKVMFIIGTQKIMLCVGMRCEAMCGVVCCEI